MGSTMLFEEFLFEKTKKCAVATFQFKLITESYDCCLIITMALRI